ncbi:dTDP-4-dehydrorhamnose reductase [Acidithiobacillus sulfuriphilus]|uniref:dTDP-4-dehydrorhamnose reductase n=2 Tax=Acidithiobacillus sulfuriphilus TaxID=1867749 RepID=A0A3M8QPQ2_9PROT|nr:dTDP-4-dehydrorhamnose reductase [Acidithiobacillus sulfuriphilus]RNF58138.1 dTDP-4-dehydrorhamnose reductase [Acidithiobacillus sulfuriphilus]
MMRVLIFGAAGQAGWELQRSAPAEMSIRALARQDADIARLDAVRAAVQHWQPQWIINAAAYTAVDRAESEAASAYAINRDGAAHIAQAALEAHCQVLHISTDFVFDGQSPSPYAPDASVHPLGVYGASKAAGEEAVRQVLGDGALIFRTAWVYSSHGHNFVRTMLKLMAEREELRIVADQIGSPTWAAGLAQAIWRAIGTKDFRGTQHWTDAGIASWYDFAVAIQEEAVACGLLARAIPILPIRSMDYPTPARRPACAVLDKSGSYARLGTAPHWRVALRVMLQKLLPASSPRHVR